MSDGQISVTIILSGNVTDEAIERAQECVHGITTGEVKVYPRSILAPWEVLVGGHGPVRAG